MKTTISTEQALTRLNQILQMNNIAHKELYQFFTQLAIENEQLKLTVQKLRTQASKPASKMHSKLTDALRE